ncbi:MAG: sulfotransferase [Acidimicrobiales bacterium]
MGRAPVWWNSASRTIFEAFNGDALPPPPMTAWFETLRGLLADSGIDPTDEASSKIGYERHLEAVRAEVPAERLVEWTTGDGWAPLCAALGVAVPVEPFPHVNTTEEFRARFDERVASAGAGAGTDAHPAADPQ